MALPPRFSLVLLFVALPIFSTLAFTAAPYCSSSSLLAHAPTATTTQLLAESLRQAEYGKSLPMPETYVKCGRCQTAFALHEDDIGATGRRRLGCCVCGHSWFQSRDRLLKVRSGFELASLPDSDRKRIELNLKEGKDPGFMGDIKVYVGNIPFEAHEDDLVRLFSTVGSVSDVSLVRDDEGNNRGFGFVTMRTKEEGEKAIAELNGASVRGRTISVCVSNS